MKKWTEVVAVVHAVGGPEAYRTLLDRMKVAPESLGIELTVAGRSTAVGNPGIEILESGHRRIPLEQFIGDNSLHNSPVLLVPGSLDAYGGICAALQQCAELAERCIGVLVPHDQIVQQFVDESLDTSLQQMLRTYGVWPLTAHDVVAPSAPLATRWFIDLVDSSEGTLGKLLPSLAGTDHVLCRLKATNQHGHRSTYREYLRRMLPYLTGDIGSRILAHGGGAQCWAFLDERAARA
ncbi:MAG: hypothetical protein IT290_07225 [Deltaproteobacteria bacterium]|nr:hypothetical protein [Deltaproteobacteria bacterium]